MDLNDTVYKGSFGALMRFIERRETPYTDLTGILPAPDIDLTPLVHAIVDGPPDPVAEFDTNDAKQKLRRLRHQLDGLPELFVLHAMCISILRRRDPPQEALDLFFRIWREQGRFMAKNLPIRWLISTATTFGDHGLTPAQRQLGLGLSLMFDLIKLHDSERRLTRRPGDKAFLPRRKHPDPVPPLAFDMYGYSLTGGDLDRTMLAKLWRLAEEDPVIAPLGFRMLNMVMSDQRTIFARMRQLRKRSSNARE